MASDRDNDTDRPFELVLVEQLVAPVAELVDVDERELPPVPVPPALCAGCRHRLADGVLQPGSVPLCVGCAVETVEHWLEWLDDPSHDWHPTDDPFSSALHPVEGWRSTELESGAVRV